MSDPRTKVPLMQSEQERQLRRERKRRKREERRRSRRSQDSALDGDAIFLRALPPLGDTLAEYAEPLLTAAARAFAAGIPLVH